MTDLVLGGKPEALNIPYFAMEREPRSYVRRLDLRRELKRDGDIRGPRIFGSRKVAAWIQDHLLDSGMELISTRDLYPRLTALYMKWLAFPDQTSVATFLDCWPQYRIEQNIAKLEKERNELAQKMSERVTSGGFDLSNINEADAGKSHPGSVRWVRKSTTSNGECDLSGKQSGWEESERRSSS